MAPFGVLREYWRSLPDTHGYVTSRQTKGHGSPPREITAAIGRVPGPAPRRAITGNRGEHTDNRGPEQGSPRADRSQTGSTVASGPAMSS